MLHIFALSFTKSSPQISGSYRCVPVTSVDYFIISPCGFCKHHVRRTTKPLSVGSWHPLSSKFKCENNKNKKASLHSFVYLLTFPCESLKVPLRRKFCIPFSLQLLKVEVTNTYHAKFYIEIPTGRPVILNVKFSFVLPPLLDSKNGREPHRELDLVAPRGI